MRVRGTRRHKSVVTDIGATVGAAAATGSAHISVLIFYSSIVFTGILIYLDLLRIRQLFKRFELMIRNVRKLLRLNQLKIGHVSLLLGFVQVPKRIIPDVLVIVRFV